MRQRRRFDPVYIDKLFQPFQQLHGADEYGGTGPGTGLAIVRRIIERHGGQIWAEGAVGQGATFCLTFGAQDAPVDGEASLRTLNGGDGKAHPELSGAA